MEQKRSNNSGRKHRKRQDRVLHVPAGGLGKSSRGSGKLAQTVKVATRDWNTYENTFITQCGDNGFVLKLKSLAHDEQLFTRTIKQHADLISLVGVYGKSDKFTRERLLGYILLYVGTPIVHAYTWFVAVCYTEELDVRRKDPAPLVTDDNIRFFKAGIGVCDYLFCYKAKTKEHDEAGFSDGATHLETADNWRDGL